MISSTIRTLRKANGYTQKQIAEKLSIDRSTYSYYEIGKITPSVNSLITLSKLYGLTLDEIVNYEQSGSYNTAASDASQYEVDSVLTQDEKKLVLSYRSLSDEEKEDVLISVVNIARQSDT